MLSSKTINKNHYISKTRSSILFYSVMLLLLSPSFIMRSYFYYYLHHPIYHYVVLLLLQQLLLLLLVAVFVVVVINIFVIILYGTYWVVYTIGFYFNRITSDMLYGIIVTIHYNINICRINKPNDILIMMPSSSSFNNYSTNNINDKTINIDLIYTLSLDVLGLFV